MSVAAPGRCSRSTTRSSASSMACTRRGRRRPRRRRELVALNERAGRRARASTPTRCGTPDGRRGARRQRRARRAPSPVAQAYAGHQFGGYSPRLGDGRALLLGEVIDVARPPARPAPEGVGAHAVRPRRRRQGRGRADAARVRHRRGDARARHPDHAGRSPSSPPASRSPARRLLPGAVLARVAASHLRVGTFQYAAATGDADARCGASPTTRSPATTRRRRRRDEPVPRAVSSASSTPRRAGRPLDARRVHPRRDEHRQHDDLRRDDRLRPVRVHGRLRPGHGVQLDRPRRPLRLRQPAARSRSGTWRGSAETLLPLIDDDTDAAVAAATDVAAHVRRPLPRGTGAAGMRAKLGLHRRRRRRAGRGPARRCCAASTSTSRRSSARCRRSLRGDDARCATLFADPAAVRRVGGALARRAGRRHAAPPWDRRRDGPRQPRLHPAQPPRRGGADRGDRRRPRAVPPAARRARASRSTSGPGLEALRRARRRPASRPLRTFCGT